MKFSQAELILIQELIKKHDERKLSMDLGDSEIVEKLRKMVSDT